MKRLKKVLLIVAASLIVIILAGITLTIGWRPIIGPRMRAVTTQKFESTPARLQRGEYLVNAVAGCLACHSEPDINQPGYPAKAGRIGAGQVAGRDPALGDISMPNITPDMETGIGRWTDDEVGRAIREGVDRNGQTLFPIMPYDNFRFMPDEDLASVVVYIRSLPAVRNVVPKMQVPFPINRLVMSVPEPITEPVANPDLSTPLARGAHLVRMASCAHCHTPADGQGQLQENLAFAGGAVFELPDGKKLASLNLTSDPSGIPHFDEMIFINFMRTGQFGARRMNPPMPWVTYRNMTDEDLKAVWAFVHNLKPVRHRVDNSMEPTMCPICGNVHGAGDLNKVIQ